MGLDDRLRRVKQDLEVETRTYPPRCMTPLSRAVRAAELLPEEPSQNQLEQIVALLRESERWVGRFIDELVSFNELLGAVIGDIATEAEGAGPPVYEPEPMIGGEPVDHVLERMAGLYRQQGRDVR